MPNTIAAKPRKPDDTIKTLALIAAGDNQRRENIFPYLLRHLDTCRPKDVPQHAEKTLVAVVAANKAEFIHVLEQRMADMTDSQATRVRRAIKEAEKR
jgi:hypothetical protein